MIKIDSSKYKALEEKHADWCYKKIINLTWGKIFKNIPYIQIKNFIFFILNDCNDLSDELNAQIPFLDSAKNIKSFIQNLKIKDFIIRSNLNECIIKIKNNYPEEFDLLIKPKPIESKKKALSDADKYLVNFKELIEGIFSYNNLQQNKENWSRNKLIYSLEISTCPYCERQLTSNFLLDDSERTTAECDHFYPQSKYPYLALSLYNFVPSCSFCNTTEQKGNTDTFNEPHIYPLMESFDDFNVNFKTKDGDMIKHLLGIKKENSNEIVDFEIEFKNFENLNNDDKNKVKNSINTFKLDKLYRTSHNHYIKELLENSIEYPDSYVKAMSELFYDKPKESDENYQIMKDNYDKNIKNLESDLKITIKKPYTDRIEKGEPLSKLTKDIMEEFGIK